MYVTLVTALANGLYHSLQTSFAALKAAGREPDGPADRWLRQQLQEFEE